MKLEREINAIYEETLNNVNKDVSLVQAELIDLLDKYSTSDGTLNRNKTSELFEHVDRLSTQEGKKIYEETTEGMSKTTLATVIFLVANVEFITSRNRLDTEKDIALKRWVGDLNLRDRTVLQAGLHSDEVRTIIRQGVYRETPIPQIREQVRQYYDGESWKLDRIVESEVYNTHRLQFGHTVEQNGGEYIQFNEYFPASKNRERHECYAYARENPYGLGEGIFKVTDDKIYAPHPQCTSYLSVPNIGGGNDAD